MFTTRSHERRLLTTVGDKKHTLRIRSRKYQLRMARIGLPDMVFQREGRLSDSTPPV
jgi:hypothetical protein